MQDTTLLTHALAYAGLREVKGPKSDPFILDMIHTVFPGWRDDSTIAWCSCCMNAWAVSMCYENTMHLKHPGLARGWLEVGEVIERKDLKVGDLVIFDRGPGKGHVGFFLRDHGTHITVFGGNQGNAITQSDYRLPFLGGRRLRPV
ncbi:MAG: hypothetical protein AAGA31_14195 [Bacteroidota bacterium]